MVVAIDVVVGINVVVVVVEVVPANDGCALHALMVPVTRATATEPVTKRR